MKTVKIGMIGFGNVGQGFVQALIEQQFNYKRDYGLDFIITAVVTRTRGCAYSPSGIDLYQLKYCRNLNDVQDAEHPNWNALTLINNADADVILELTQTDLHTGEPAVLYMQEAILSGKSVVTSNKGPIARHFKMLKTLADENHVKIGYEGTVLGGSPAIRLGTDFLAGAGIVSFQGILNGTTNYILTQMEDGKSFDEALIQAQDLGYAESDPSNDVDGFDTAGKTVILSNLLLGSSFLPEDIETKGIREITSQDITSATKQGCRWKLIGSGLKTKNGFQVSAKPIMLPLSNPLAHVDGVINAIQYETSLLGTITLTGVGAGRLESGFAVISDLISMFR